MITLLLTEGLARTSLEAMGNAVERGARLTYRPPAFR